MMVARDSSSETVIFSITLPATLAPLQKRIEWSTIETMKQTMSDDEIKQKFYNELKQSHLNEIFHLSGSPLYPNTN
jgi:superfamily II DNA/RNA helicase